VHFSERIQLLALAILVVVASCDSTQSATGFTRQRVVEGFESARIAVGACLRAAHLDHVVVSVSIQGNGSLDAVRVLGMQSSPARDCIEEAVRAASFSKFDGPPQEVAFQYRL
jgi:hypothetical protein